MASRKRPAAAQESVHVGRDDLDGGDDLAVVVGPGGPLLAPRSIRNADVEAQDACRRLQATVAEIQRLQLRLEEDAAAARARGLSWSAIGWCLGLTGEAARKRFTG